MEYAKMIEVPKSGDEYFKTKLKIEKSYTKVNEVKLCEFIEGIYKQILSDFSKDNLALKRGMTESLLKARFTIK